jgi:hypothetical protein
MKILFECLKIDNLFVFHIKIHYLYHLTQLIKTKKLYKKLFLDSNISAQQHTHNVYIIKKGTRPQLVLNRNKMKTLEACINKK